MSQLDAFPEVEPYAGNTDENQRFTTDEADAWLRSVAGVKAWDLDVAACTESHRAEHWYGLEASGDGLKLPWYGRVFCNPPWNDITPWIECAWEAMAQVSPVPMVIAMLLPLRTHMGWWQSHVEPFRDGRSSYIRLSAHLEVRHPPKRFTYGHPGNPRAIGVDEPNFQTVGLIWRHAK